MGGLRVYPDGMHHEDGCTPQKTDSQPLAGMHPTGMHTCWRWLTSFFIVWDQSEEAIMRLATSDWVSHC